MASSTAIWFLRPSAGSSLPGLLMGGTPALMIARPPSVQKLLGNDENINSVSPRSKARLILSRAGFDHFVGQLEIVETRPEHGALVLFLPLELFLGLLVALTKRIALGEERGH